MTPRRRRALAFVPRPRRRRRSDPRDRLGPRAPSSASASASARRPLARASATPPSPRKDLDARRFVAERVLVKRAGIGNPACLIHRRREGAPADVAAEEIMELLVAVQAKLGMGTAVASLVDAEDGSELDFERYANPPGPTKRVFPPGGGVRRPHRRGDAREAQAALEEVEEATIRRSSASNPKRTSAADGEARAKPKGGPGAPAWSAAPGRHRRGRARGRPPPDAPAVRVAVPSYVDTIGEALLRVSEAMREDESDATFGVCVSLSRVDEGSRRETGGDVRRVSELVDGATYVARCASESAVSDARAPPPPFEVDVASAADPHGEPRTFRLPGSERALARMTLEEVTKRAEAALGRVGVELIRFDGTRVTSPKELAPGTRLLWRDAADPAEGPGASDSTGGADDRGPPPRWSKRRWRRWRSATRPAPSPRASKTRARRERRPPPRAPRRKRAPRRLPPRF